MVHNISLTQQTTVLAGVITVIATAVGTYIYNKLKQPKIPTEWRAVGTVKEICIYPLKSGCKISVQKAECTKRGPMEVEKFNKSLRLRDRSFVVYNETNLEFRTIRQYSKLVLVEVKAQDMNCVTFNAPGMKTLVVKIPCKENNPEVIIKHCRKEPIPSTDCGDEAAAWISKFCTDKDSGLRLAYHEGIAMRNEIPKLYNYLNDYYKRNLRAESAGLNSDLSAVHIINQASIYDLNRRMGNSSVTSDNFRCNLLVDGPDLKPFAEDEWEWIKVGDVVLKNVLECTRCIIPTVDPQTGIRSTEREPSKTMEAYRMSKGPDKAPVMGIHLEVFETGLLNVGDTVYVGKK